MSRKGNPYDNTVAKITTLSGRLPRGDESDEWVADAAACCSQGVAFILANENYPELETDITVVGTFQTYLEDGAQYCHLVDAVLE